MLGTSDNYQFGNSQDIREDPTTGLVYQNPESMGFRWQITGTGTQGGRIIGLPQIYGVTLNYATGGADGSIARNFFSSAFPGSTGSTSAIQERLIILDAWGQLTSLRTGGTPAYSVGLFDNSDVSIATAAAPANTLNTTFRFTTLNVGTIIQPGINSVYAQLTTSGSTTAGTGTVKVYLMCLPIGGNV